MKYTLCALLVGAAVAQYGPPPSGKTKHRTTTTTEIPPSVNEILPPSPYQAPSDYQPQTGYPQPPQPQPGQQYQPQPGPQPGPGQQPQPGHQPQSPYQPQPGLQPQPPYQPQPGPQPQPPYQPQPGPQPQPPYQPQPGPQPQPPYQPQPGPQPQPPYQPQPGPQPGSKPLPPFLPQPPYQPQPGPQPRPPYQPQPGPQPQPPYQPQPGPQPQPPYQPQPGPQPQPPYQPQPQPPYQPQPRPPYQPQPGPQPQPPYQPQPAPQPQPPYQPQPGPQPQPPYQPKPPGQAWWQGPNSPFKPGPKPPVASHPQQQPAPYQPQPQTPPNTPSRPQPGYGPQGQPAQNNPHLTPIPPQTGRPNPINPDNPFLQSALQKPIRQEVQTPTVCRVPNTYCVQSSLCYNGVIADLAPTHSLKTSCAPGEVCCKGKNPVGYQPGGTPQQPGSQPQPRPYVTEASVDKYTGPLNTTPHPGCPAALKCVDVIYCTAEGVMSNTPVYLTREQTENRVPMTDCQDVDTGLIGKCCRDPNYKDPWPAGMPMPMGKFDDGLYHPSPEEGGFEPTDVPVENPHTLKLPLGVFNQQVTPFPVVSKPKPGQTHSQVFPGNEDQSGGKPLLTPHHVGPSYQPQPQQPQQPLYQPQPQTQPQQPGYQPQPQTQPQQPQRPSYPPQPQTQPQQPQQPGYPQTQPQTQPQQPQQPSYPPRPQTQPQQPQQPGYPQTQPQTQPQQPQQPSYPPRPQTQPQQPQQPGYPQTQPQQPQEPSYPSQPQTQPQQPQQPGYQPQPQPQQPTYQPQPQQSNYLQPAPQPKLPYQAAQPQQPGQHPQPQSQGQAPFPQDSYSPVVKPNPGNVCGVRRPAPQGLSEDEAGFGEFPWQAVISIRNNNSNVCSGAIIAPNAILTSAHCIEGLNAEDLEIKAGGYKLGQEGPHPSQTRPVAAAAIHPTYNSESLQKDQAVIVTEEPLTLDQHVDTVCLPQSTEDYEPDTNVCYVTGYGRPALQRNTPGTPLHRVKVDILPRDRCENNLKKTDHLGKYFKLIEGFICAAPPKESELCKVDIGSPLVCQRSDGQYELVGVYSWDTKCSTKLPGVMAGCDTQWINQVLATPIAQLKQKYGKRPEITIHISNIDEKPGFALGYGK